MGDGNEDPECAWRDVIKKETELGYSPNKPCPDCDSCNGHKYECPTFLRKLRDAGRRYEGEK